MKRRLALALGIALAPLAISAACTFPDVTFANDGGSSESSVQDGPDQGDGGKPPVDGPNIVEATSPRDLADAAACEAGLLKPCDCDDDGFADIRCDAGTIEAGGLKPGDCDDLNPARNPGIQDFSTQPTTDGDWNCDKNPEHYWKEGTDWCKSVLLSGGVAACVSDEGFNRVVGCGEKADFHICTGNALLNQCKLQVKDPNNRQAPQACR